MRIGSKINLSFLLIFLVIASVAGYVINSYSTQILKARSLDEILHTNGSKAEHVRTFLRSEAEVVESLASSTTFHDFLIQNPSSNQYWIDKDITSQRLNRSIGAVKQIYELFILDKNGKVVVSTDATHEGLDRSQDPYFTGAKSGVFIKDLYYSQTVNKYTYSVSYPILDDQTKALLGVMVARMDPETLFGIIKNEITPSSTEDNFLINKDFYLLTPTKFLGADNILKRRIITANSVACFDSTAATLVNFKDYRGADAIGTRYYIPETGWCLITKIDQSEVLAPNRQLFYIFIIIFIISVILFILIGFIVSRNIIRPIHELRDEMAIIERGNWNYKVRIKSRDEVSELFQSFNTMVQAVKKSHAEVNKKVQEQTFEIIKKQRYMEDQQRATLNILEDVDEEKSKLQSEEQKLDSIIHSIGDAVFVVDNDLNITLVNNVASALCGYSASEMIGHYYGNFLKFFLENGADKSIGDDFIQDAISSGKIKEMANHTVLLTKDGEKIPVSDSAAPLKDDDGNILGCVVVFRDVAKERALDRAKTEFVSLASHQLRTPLTYINWYSEMLLNDKEGKLSKAQVNYADEVRKGSKRMVDLINGLLNVSRLEAGTLGIDRKKLNIIEIAKDLVKEIGISAKEKGINIVEEYSKNDITIYHDSKLVRILFQNLISNAVKYTPNNGKVRVSVSARGDKINIVVSDTGYGIPKDQQDRIFQKFFRAANIMTKDTTGTGLGLYIVKSIIDQSKGKIWFKSQVNKGTSFFMQLPIKGIDKKEGTKSLEA
jgi:PAS domain S-box-containing protein